MRLKRTLALFVAIGVLSIGAVACRPAPGPPEGNFSDAVIAAVFAPDGPGVVQCMLAVADRESTDSPPARNASGASGLFQLELPLHNDLFIAAGYSPASWADPYANARAAKVLFDSSGIGPWRSC
jgi:hypothetical protein